MRPSVIVVGGGFGGAWTARRLGDRADVTLVSDDNFLLFTPMLAEVAAADVDPRHILTPLRHLCPGAKLVVGTAVEVSQADMTVRVSLPTETEPAELTGDAIVIAAGSDTATYGVPGVEDHAMPFKTVSDALSIRHRLIGFLEASDHRSEPSDTTVAIVGGGAAGAEVAAALADFLRRAIRRYYRGAPQPRVILIDRAHTVLPTLPRRASEKGARALRRRKVELRLGTRVTGIEPGAIRLDDGTSIEARTIIWAAGVKGTPIPGDLSAAPDGTGRYRVDSNMRLSPGIWALGDVAAVPDGRGGICPPTAQHALRQGDYLGRHLPDLIQGRQVAPFRYRSMGQLISLGHRSAVGRVLGVTVGGFLAWFLWRSYYLLRLPSMVRRLRVAFDWTLDLIFPPDVADPPTADPGPDFRK